MADFLLLIRSGKTAYDLDHRIKGTLDIPLAAEGVEEAHSFGERAARLLEEWAAARRADSPLRLFTSAARCARETATIVGHHLGAKPRTCAGLGNIDHGLWQGLRVEEIEERQPRLHRQWRENPWSVAPPEGELLDECRDRVAAAVEAIARRHAKGGIALVVPEPLERIIRWLVAGEPLGDLWEPIEGAPGVSLLPLAAQWTAAAAASRRGPAELALRQITPNA